MELAISMGSGGEVRWSGAGWIRLVCFAKFFVERLADPNLNPRACYFDLTLTFGLSERRIFYENDLHKE